MTHLTFEELSELAERAAAPESVAARHLAECEVCRATHARVRDLVVVARALPREVAPPPEVWDALRDRVATRRADRRRWWHNGWVATAAGIVLVLGTATFMTMLARGKSMKAKAVMVSAPATSPALLVVDKNYVATIRDLRATLDLSRAHLAPSTVRTLEHSLAVIDSAIAEARAALAADPSNQALIDILAAHYERQVDLLQRATELSPSL